MFIHLTLVPFLSASGELKTKPTQHSVKTLLEYGVQPDVLCRTEHHLNKELRNKIARFCNVDQDAVIESIDAKSIYEVPVLMKEEKLDEVVLRKLSMPSTVEPSLSNWSLFLEKWSNPKKTVRIVW